MSHSPSRRKVDKEFARREAEETARRAAEDRAAAAYALRIVALWNARAGRSPPSFYPTFRTALTARMTRLTIMCPGCQQVGDVDLRTIDRHPDAAISSVIPALSCRRCSPNPPFARLLRLSKSGSA